MKPQVPGSQEPPAAGKGKVDSPLKPPEGAQFWPPELTENTFRLFEATWFVVARHGSLRQAAGKVRLSVRS